MQLEMEEHVELRIEELEAQGLPSKEARRKALVEFGGVDQLKEDCRESWGIGRIDGYLKDLKFAFRMIFKHKLSSAVSIITLSIGMGAFIAFFNLMDVGFGRVMPVEKADRLFDLRWNFPNGGHASPKKFEFPYLNSLSETFVSLSHSYAKTATVRTDTSFARWGSLLYHTRDYPDQVGLYPKFGRGFLERDYEWDAPPVVFMNHFLAEEMFGDAKDSIGMNLWIDGESHTVVGVMPKGYAFPNYTDFWAPIKEGEIALQEDFKAMTVVELKARSDHAKASSECVALGESIMADYPGEKSEGSYLGLRPFEDVFLQQEVKWMIMLVYISLGLFLCLTCANVSIIILSRAAQREQELAIRSSLGASGKRIMVQAMIESLSLTLCGLLLGTLISLWFSDYVISFIENKVGVPISDGRVFDWTYYFLFLGVTAAVTFLCGWVPARRAAKVEASNILHGDSYGSNHKLGYSTRLMACAQIAISSGLLIGLTIIYFELPSIFDINIDNELEDALCIKLEPKKGVPYNEYARQVKQELESQTSIAVVALSDRQLMRPKRVSVDTDVNFQTDPRMRQRAVQMVIGPDYFRTFDREVVQGRSFNIGDSATAERVAIVNRNFVNHFFPNADPIGKLFFRYKGEKEREGLRIVGIAPDMKMGGMFTNRQRASGIYVAADQMILQRGFLSIKYEGNRYAAERQIREVFKNVNPEQPVVRIVDALHHLIVSVTALKGVLGTISTLLAISIFLAALGLFGMMRFSVKQRTKEFGIRLAVGASRRLVSWSILKQGMKVVSIGLLFGFLLGFAIRIPLSAMAYGSSIASLNFLKQSFYGILLFLLVSVIAIAIPTRSATRIQPMEALRHD